MVFVTVGTSKGDFKRLFSEIDRLVQAGILHDVVAQIGYTGYIPRHYQHKDFFPQNEQLEHIKQADFIICHGGAGSLEECVGAKKKVIVVPRLSKYREAYDNHQLEISTLLSNLNRVLMVQDMNELEAQVRQLESWTPEFKVNDGKERIINAIQNFMEETVKGKNNS